MKESNEEIAADLESFADVFRRHGRKVLAGMLRWLEQPEMPSERIVRLKEEMYRPISEAFGDNDILYVDNNSHLDYSIELEGYRNREPYNQEDLDRIEESIPTQYRFTDGELVELGVNNLVRPACLPRRVEK